MMTFICPKENRDTALPMTSQCCESMCFDNGCKFLKECAVYQNAKENKKVFVEEKEEEVFDANL